ncbi:hypothetical protein AAFF_G00118040 [Aldrovandia affinis]|uniref:Uncharacterized protein n=1 Tax=Aldrovandia affinis TaxID=143900 RepID=A0AAD7RSL3_9TELE|nr:hypothetical protein AAFF_G00118040 [Aldrovandia affinis]
MGRKKRSDSNGPKTFKEHSDSQPHLWSGGPCIWHSYGSAQISQGSKAEFTASSRPGGKDELTQPSVECAVQPKRDLARGTDIGYDGNRGQLPDLTGLEGEDRKLL